MKIGYTITVAPCGRVCVVDIRSNANKPYGCRYVDDAWVSHKVWLSGEELSKNRQKRNRSGNHAASSRIASRGGSLVATKDIAARLVASVSSAWRGGESNMAIIEFSEVTACWECSQCGVDFVSAKVMYECDTCGTVLCDECLPVMDDECANEFCEECLEKEESKCGQ